MKVKNFLFLFIIGIVLAACGNNSGSDDVEYSITNKITYDGNSYDITNVVLDKSSIEVFSNECSFTLTNYTFEIGKKNYLSSKDEKLSSIISTNKGVYIVGKVTPSSYVSIIDNPNDNRKQINIYISDGTKELSVSYFGTTKEPDNSNHPIRPDSEIMLEKIGGKHNATITFPKNEFNNSEEVTTNTTIDIKSNNGSFTIERFPVRIFANYVKDESIRSIVSQLSDCEITGEFLPWDYSTMLFAHNINDISFMDKIGNSMSIAFYKGYNNYSLAGYSTDKTTGKKSFLMYITIGEIYENGVLKSDVIYKTKNNYPYVCYLKYDINE